MIEAYFFDWFGTLAVSRGYDHKFMIKQAGEDGVNRLLVGPLAEAGLSNAAQRNIERYLIEAVYELYPDSQDVIRRLKLQKKRVALISNMYDVSGRIVRELWGQNFLNEFDHVTFSCEVGLMKPDPQIFLYTCFRVGVEPCDVVMIGDLPVDLKVPGGMQARVIDRRIQTLAEVVNA